ncbi:MAG TPA: hypothetical protein VD866_31005, partial [Urbifossiella sp.]|nr:hypothetical protein [Urbifossiella sp.]
MRASGSVAVLVLLPLLGIARQPGPESPLPPADRTPQLVVRHAGPHAPVTSLAFGPDGTLYAGGFGKVVHRYTPAGGKFVPAEPIRVPVGPGNAGAVNAVAVSPDGKWVAVAGRAPLRGENWTASDDGIVVESRYFPPLLKRDSGVVYLFDPADPRGGKVIRGPEAGIRALAFATPGPAAGPVLVTAGVEWDAAGKFFGAVRVHDVASGKELARRDDLPGAPNRPGLAAWAADGKLRVAVAWPPADNTKPGGLLVWDVTAKADQPFPDGLRTVALALRTGPDGAARELVSGAVVGAYWGLAARPAAPPVAGRLLPLSEKNNEFFLPLALAPVGETTAAVLQRFPQPPGTTGRVSELRLVAADGTAKGRVTLKGVAASGLPSVAASPDGKWVAVAGFDDDRIEVYDAAALAAGRPVVQVLAGEPGGFARVAFVAGNKLWLGGATDEAPRGGTVLDLAARTAAPGGAGLALDVTPGGGPLPYDPKAQSVTVTVGGKEQKLELRENEVPTAVVLLPAGPAWDKALGPVVAVAHYHRTALVSLITLFDATDGRRLLQLGGPTLPVDGLAFSGSRPLLAAVGADRTVAVWSLKALAAPFPAVEGITLVERDGKLAVAGVAPTSPARAALKPGDVVEAVGGEKGALRPVTTYRDFHLAVREVPVGGTARVKVAGAAPAAVPVGRGVGHRHPLFELWVNPVANADGGRDWIGWTPAGPYDANTPAAEARLGWLTATGNPAEPVVFAGADQYRRLYYKTGFLRFLADTADFDAALKQYVAEFPRTRPELAVRADGAEERDGARLLRARAAALVVDLHDPDGVLQLDAAELRWRAAGGDWRVVPFRDKTATLPLAGHEWARGVHRFEFEVRETAELPPALTQTAGFRYVPAAPTARVLAGGKAVEHGADVTSPADKLALQVQAEGGEKVVVTVTTNAPGGDRPVALKEGKDGRFEPYPLPLNPNAKTAVRVTARNAAAAEDFARYETHTTEFVVWHTTPAPRPVPRVTLGVASTVDAPAAPGRPYVSDGAKVSLSASIVAVGMTKVEWDDGDGVWVAGELPAKGVAARDVTIKAGGVPKTLRVRVTAGGEERTDSVSVVWAALPDADFGALPQAVRGSRLLAAGPVRAAAGGGPFRVKVLVDSPDAGTPPREFDIRAGEPGTWASDVELAPGDNRLSLAVANEWKQVRVRSREVRYVRPPVVVGVEPIAARGPNVGDVFAAVVSPAELPPDRLTLDGRTLAARAHGSVTVFGVGFWWLRAEGVPLATGDALPPAVRVAAGNADGEGEAVEATVIPIPKAPPPPPPPPSPKIVVTAGKDAAVVAAGAALRTDEPEFAFGLRVTSAVKLTRVAVLRPEEVPGVSAEKAVAADGGFALTAAPTVMLREGVNTFEVTASNGHTPSEFRFSVSYTPPPVRVVIDEVAELPPGAAPRPLPRPAGGAAFSAAGNRVQVKGRVVFSDPAAAARSSGFDVVLYGNDVRHLPAEVDALAPGKNEAPFSALVFLSAKTTTVRVEVARHRQTDPVPQQLADTRVVVETGAPLTEQRLHVLVVAPEEAENRGGAMAREVIATLNGEFIGSPVGFTEGPFRHKAFASATMYRPLVYSVSRPDLVGQLNAVESRVRELAAAGPAGYVNDVVLVYYQGRDLMGRDGVRRVHTTRSLAIPSPAAAEPHAVRLDALPPTSGVRFTVLNVVTQDGAPPAQRVTTGPMLLRYAWQNRESFAELLGFYRAAIAANRTVGS